MGIPAFAIEENFPPERFGVNEELVDDACAVGVFASAKIMCGTNMTQSNVCALNRILLKFLRRSLDRFLKVSLKGCSNGKFMKTPGSFKTNVSVEVGVCFDFPFGLIE